MKRISIVTPCYNEEDNVEIMISVIKDVMEELPQYEYEHILIDNHSSDHTWDKLKKAAAADTHVKAIENVRNFGPLRSIAYGMFQMQGDAAVVLACDMQDPPRLIPQFIQKWESGYLVVLGTKTKSEENPAMYAVRSLYYKIISLFSEIPEFEHTTGFGLYDRSVVSQLKSLQDPEPSLRHLIADLGYEAALIEYKQPKRVHGKSSYNFFTYFDYALNTLVNTSRVPLKLATYMGFVVSFVSLLTAACYLVWKLKNWMHFDTGQAPLLIGIFFIGGVLLLFLGIMGEYVGEILSRVTRRPLIVEQERVNFERQRTSQEDTCIRHIGIYVEDIVKMERFYTEAFDMHKICSMQPESGPMLDQLLCAKNVHVLTTKLISDQGKVTGSGDMIEFIKTDSKEGMESSTGLTHVAFGIHDMEQIVDKILEKGGRKKTDIFTMENGNKCCFMADPEDNWIELIERIS